MVEDADDTTIAVLGHALSMWEREILAYSSSFWFGPFSHGVQNPQADELWPAERGASIVPPVGSGTARRDWATAAAHR